MSPDHITTLIVEYRYWILVPLSVFEGPLVAFASGTLASLGYFNVYVLAIFFFLLDMAKDAFYYALGYWGRDWRVTRHILKKLGVDEGHLEHVREIWEKHAGKTMFLGKLSYGIAASFVVLAGTVRMPLRKFFGWGAVVAVAQFWTLLALGYLFGTSLPNSTRIVQDIGYAVGVIALFGSAYYVFSFYMRKKWEKEERGE
ncbi:MAG: hypothetical protein NUV59_01810 [Patescibacteria group bacterium]|nr:hypothetical protein [Patescibacteria group bacterium]